jgi:hypothetical protein
MNHRRAPTDQGAGQDAPLKALDRALNHEREQDHLPDVDQSDL